ncbi:MAG: hypothetical protein ACJAT2_000311 [Bacteriovoracaceae bacterium]|jgi:hypothetical protein
MKSLLLTVLFVFSFNANANLFLPSCYNHIGGTDAVSFSYQSCINSNFRAIERELEGNQFFSYCSNIGNDVSFSFISCVQRNFREVERALRPTNVFLNYCSNFTRDRLDFSFTSCVNSNWRSVERAVR